MPTHSVERALFYSACGLVIAGYGLVGAYLLALVAILAALSWRAMPPLGLAVIAFPIMTGSTAEPWAIAVMALLALIPSHNLEKVHPAALGFGLIWGGLCLHHPLAFPLGLLCAFHFQIRPVVLTGLIGLGIGYGMSFVDLAALMPVPTHLPLLHAGFMQATALGGIMIGALCWMFYFRLRRRGLLPAHPLAHLSLTGLIAIAFSLIAIRAGWVTDHLIAASLAPLIALLSLAMLGVANGRLMLGLLGWVMTSLVVQFWVLA